MRGATGLAIAAAAAALTSLLTAPAPAAAHGGGTDRCGGHHDHKRGGYHVHNYSTYCGCYPEYAVCRNYLKDRENEGPAAEDPAPTEDGGDWADKTPDGGTGGAER